MSIRIWLGRLLAIFQKQQLEQELNEEIRTHLEMAAQENLLRGLNAPEALEAARRSLGTVEQMKEEHRDQRGIPWLEALLRDTKHGARFLLRDKAFAVTVVLTLAICTAANVTTFAAIALRKVIQNEIYGVGPLDPLVIGGVMALLGVIALAASFFPARRATQINPADVLNQQ